MEDGMIVVGSVNVDLVLRTRRLPRPGETVIGGSFQRSPGGKGANAAAAAARLGARTWLVGLVGPDDLGRDARQDLEAAGVDVGAIGTGGNHTGVAAVLVDEDGENLIAVASGANAELSAPGVREAMSGIDTGRAVVIGNFEVPDAAVVAAAEISADRGWPFVLNPAPARQVPGELLARCSVVVANQVEAGPLGSVDAVLEAGPDAVVVTRGAGGAELHRRGRPPHHQPAFPVRVADTTGAGDAFVATVAWSLLEGRALEEGLRLAAAAGALACRRVGARAGFPDRVELERFAADRP
jgi:ribokinase